MSTPHSAPPHLKEVSSLKNPIIKEVIALAETAKARKSSGRFLVEGLREVKRAITSGWTLETALFNPALLSPGEVEALINDASARRTAPRQAPLINASSVRSLMLVSCSAHVFERVSYRSSVANIVGVFSAQNHSLKALGDSLNISSHLSSHPLYLVAERVEKPGNLGALLRTADAMGVSAVFVCDGHGDLYHPNTLRNSLGGFFNLPVVSCESAEAIRWFQERDVQLVATYLEGAQRLETLDLSQPTALIVGAEDRGVTRDWVEASDALALIPMNGVVDSLNVSVAAGMALFEATRQRRALSGSE